LSVGDMEESFDAAMNTLTKVGDITAPVKTSFGYHIIKLTELIEGTTQSLDEVKSEIVSVLQKTAAEEQFFAKSKILEEKSFEISDSLVEVSALTGIEIKTSPVFSSAKASGIFANQEVKDAAFSDNVINAGMNSNLVNVNDGHVVVVRLNSHQASVIQELDAVKERVVNRIKSTKAKDAALAYGETIKNRITVNEDVTDLLASKNLQWQDLDKIGRTATVLPYRQLQQFFKLATPSDGMISTDIMSDSAELVVFVLNKVEDGSLESAEKSLADQAQQRLLRFYSNASYISLVEQARNQAEVTRNLDNINR
ncbi:MAG: peptidyl-prolyl cis-trans isomerase, partial [Kangiellaceae bacterium]|nr:peptidyl-prolyl cis-trans isomerase [Kangiellaceae bacterium]